MSAGAGGHTAPAELRLRKPGAVHQPGAPPAAPCPPPAGPAPRALQEGGGWPGGGSGPGAVDPALVLQVTEALEEQGAELGPVG